MFKIYPWQLNDLTAPERINRSQKFLHFSSQNLQCRKTINDLLRKLEYTQFKKFKTVDIFLSFFSYIEDGFF